MTPEVLIRKCMNFLIGYLVGIWYAYKRLRMWGMLYFIVLVFGVLLSLPFMHVMGNAIGNSLETQKLLTGFDHTVYRDFINVANSQLQVISSQIRLVIPFFILLFVFLTGGILKSFDEMDKAWNRRDFWGNCSRYFWRIFRTFLLFFSIQLLVAALVYIPFFTWITKNLNNVANEKTFFLIGFFLIFFHLLVMTFLATVSDYTKIRLVKENRTAVLKESWDTFKWVRDYFRRTYPLYLLNAFTVVLLVLIYWGIEAKIGMVSTFTIFIMFVVQQGFIFLRLGTKLMDLASASAMYDDILNRGVKGEPPLVIAPLNTTSPELETEEKTPISTSPPLDLTIEDSDERVGDDEENNGDEALTIEL